MYQFCNVHNNTKVPTHNKNFHHQSTRILLFYILCHTSYK